MSERSLLEFNHDHTPRTDADCLALGKALKAYMRAADTRELPSGVERKHYRHHTDAEPTDVAAIPEDLCFALVCWWRAHHHGTREQKVFADELLCDAINPRIEALRVATCQVNER